METIKIAPEMREKYNGKCHCPSCTDPDTGEYLCPHYGVGPHTCYHKIPNAVIGQSQPLPKSEWPKNYVEDPDCPGMGIWYCPDCGNGITPVEIAVS